MHNYDDYTRSFAELISSVLASLTTRCRVHKEGKNGKESKEPSKTFIEEIRESWATRVKHLAEKDRDRHEALRKGLGQYYGALVTQLSAIDARWKQIEADKNPLIDLDHESNVCCVEALNHALAISDAAYAFAAALKQAENQLLARALLFCQQVESYVHRVGLEYKESDFSQYGFYVYGVGPYVREDGSISCSFSYWDNVDMIGVSLGSLFPQEEHKAEVQRLAKLCLGGFGTLSDDLYVITAAKTVPLVKIAKA